MGYGDAEVVAALGAESGDVAGHCGHLSQRIAASLSMVARFLSSRSFSVRCWSAISFAIRSAVSSRSPWSSNTRSRVFSGSSIDDLFYR